LRPIAATVLASLGLIPCGSPAASAADPRTQSPPAAAPAAPPAAAGQQTFPTPEAAAAAIIQAAERYDLGAFKAILGPDGMDLVVTEDEVQDKARAASFAALAREKLEVARDPSDARRATLIIGGEDWPMPIPIVEEGGAWRFDAAAGRDEILYRRIGENELDAIQICLGYVEAQQEYALEKHDGSMVNQYARRIISTPGRQDGLAWVTPDGKLDGPIAEGIAKAIAEGHTERYEPYHGYYFRTLLGQGTSAPLGEMDFIVNGAMIGGFALLAAPADYEVTGVKSFIVSHDGVVYEKDLGPETLEIFRTMKLYDPDPTWTPVSLP
jgi:hypothetical protein